MATIIPNPHHQTIFGQIPSKSNSYRIVTFRSKDPNKPSYAHLAKTKDLVKYERDFKLQCMKYRNANIEGEFMLFVDVYFRRAASDLDGCFKCLLDSLQDIGAIKNDNKCIRIVANKYIDAINPRIEFTIEPLTQNHGKDTNSTTPAKSSYRKSRTSKNQIPIGIGDLGSPSEFPL